MELYMSTLGEATGRKSIKKIQNLIKVRIMT